ncbi:hypothetical protein [Streptomyces hypolithicus]
MGLVWPQTLPPGAAAVDALAAHLERLPAPGVKIEDRTAPRKPRRRTARLVFPNQTASPSGAAADRT